MTNEEYQERLLSLLDHFTDLLEEDPANQITHWSWLMSATNSLIKDYYGDMRRMGE